MSTRTERRRARRKIARSQLGASPIVAACRTGPVPPPVQYLDVRVRDTHAGNALVDNAQITLVDIAAVQPNIVAHTDRRGDAIIRIPVAGVVWRVEARKEWFIPEPALLAPGILVPAHGFPVVNLVLEELRYYLHVDADRDGDVDPDHEGLNVIPAWAWGADGRGAVILCNNDHDDGLAVGLRNPDNEDDVVNANNDGTHELAPIRIRRVGPNTAPPVATNWRASLSIRNGNEDKIRIFRGMNGGDAHWVGARHGLAPRQRREFSLRVNGPPATSQPTMDLGAEATTYACQGFDGLVRIRLRVFKDSVFGGGQVEYHTGAQLRVAPWMMPHHLDDARRVYVVDLGPDVVAGGILTGGNQTFRNALGLGLNGAGIAGANYVQYVNDDRWMQDCMEIGYSVLPRNTGASRRHRIESVMQAYRDFFFDDLKEHPRQLLDADFGFHFPAHESAVDGALAAMVVKPASGTTDAYDRAEDAAFVALIEEGQAGNLLPVLTVIQANNIAAGGGVVPLAIDNAADAVAQAVEAALGGAPTAQAARANMVAQGTLAMTAQGAPFNVPAVAAAVAEAAAQGAADGANRTTTYDSNGNLECTPPCRADNNAAAVGGIAAGPKDYPWGRIYYGYGTVAEPFDARTAAFLQQQRVQLPIEIDTSWLVVGHVDEMMSFIPADGPEFRNWRLLLASPKAAFDIMDGLAGNTPILVGRQLRVGPGGAWAPVNSTVGVLRDGPAVTPIPHPNRAVGPAMNGAELRDFNLNYVQGEINNIRDQLVHEIGVVPDEIIQVPVIFIPGHSMFQAEALTADMVNMLVVNNRLIIPKPFGPIHTVTNTDVFETTLRADIRAANDGLNVRYVDDWYTYHANTGEIHCGTNTNRRPANLNAWLASEEAEWWRFDG